MEIDVPGRGRWTLRHLLLDVNGTVAEGGHLIAGVRQGLRVLREAGWQIHWITADTRGRQAALDEEMGWPAVRIEAGQEAAQKAAYVHQLGAEGVVTVGNGANDAGMLQAAAVGIAVLGPEGLAVEALQAADVLVPDIHTALALLQDPGRLVATLRR